MNKIKYSDIEVKLSGENGNAFNILFICGQAVKNVSFPQFEASAFLNEATYWDYDKLLSTRNCLMWMRKAKEDKNEIFKRI